MTHRDAHFRFFVESILSTPRQYFESKQSFDLVMRTSALTLAAAASKHGGLVFRFRPIPQRLFRVGRCLDAREVDEDKVSDLLFLPPYLCAYRNPIHNADNFSAPFLCDAWKFAFHTSIASLEYAISSLYEITKSHRHVSDRTKKALPASSSKPPLKLPNRGPTGSSFSISTINANPMTQYRFMMPPKNKIPIRPQQQPKQ